MNEIRFSDLSQFPLISYDTESTGLDWKRDSVFGVAIAVPDGRAEYWDLRKEPRVAEWLRREIPRARKIVNHNIKHDAHFSREAGLPLPLDRIDDTMFRAALLDENRMKYDLDSVGWDYVQMGKDETLYSKLADLFGGPPTRDAQMKNLHRAPVDVVAPYGARDALVAIRLYEKQEGLLAEQELGRVAAVERDLLEVLVDMEEFGVRINVPSAERAVTQMTTLIDERQKKLDAMAGGPINVNPSKLLTQFLKPEWDSGRNAFILFDGTPVGVTETGKPSITDEALRKMRDPSGELILSIRKARKTRDTFLLGHLLGHQVDGRVHANFNQTRSDNDRGTRTGRLSINEPALQQIHKRDAAVASIVRGLFIPEEGQEWMSNDWAQTDFRVFAHYARVPSMLKMYADDPKVDFHQMVSDMTGLPRKMTSGVKGNAKQINLGLVFGMGEGRMAEEMGLPFTVEEGRNGKTWLKPGPEAEMVFSQYHKAVPGVKELLEKASSIARSRGYVKTILGRRIRFPRGVGVHKAGGSIFQGTAADLMKVKMVEVHRYCKDTRSTRQLLTVHDELDFSKPKGVEGERIGADIRHIMEAFGPGDQITLRVPIVVDSTCGPTWWEASK